MGADIAWRLGRRRARYRACDGVARLLSAQLIVTLLLCAQLIDVLTTGAEVCWAELPPRTTGGISPP